MRLTLRTLLAYLDDILEPAQAREIGEKLNESSLASSLVSRIREVMRRRRLTAPTLSGPGVGIDPNAVAEYLDNTLSPDGVADVEKICLESDVHLAEVAACHQILTLALGEPVEVPSQTRERMYALGPSATRMAVSPAAAGASQGFASSTELPSEAVNDVLGQAEPANRASNSAPVRALARSIDDHSSARAIPEYLRRRSPWKGILTFTAVAAAVIVWGILVFQKSPFQSGVGNVPAESDEQGRNLVAAAGVSNPAEKATRNRNAASEPDVETANKVGQRTTERTVPPRNPVNVVETADSRPSPNTSIDLPAPDEPEEDEPPFRRRPRPGPTTGDDPPRTAAAAESATKPEPPAAEPPPVVIQVPPAKYVSPEGITLHYVGREQRWFVLPRRALVHPGDVLAVPESFECALEFEEGRGLATLPGRTAVRWMGPNESVSTAVELRRGQVVLRATTSTGAEPTPLKVVVSIYGDSWLFELPPGTVAGIDVMPPEPTKFEQEPAKGDYAGGIYVAAGKATVVDPFGRKSQISGPGWLKLPVKPPAAAGETAESRPEPGPALYAMPKWMGAYTQSATDKQIARVFERRFKLDEAVDLSLPAVAEDRNANLSKMATDTLGLIEAYSPLVNVLKRTIHDESRRAAISALRIWLPGSPDNRNLLKAELAQFYPADEADVVYKLLWGFDQDDARNRDTSLQLLEWMGNPEVSIREMAFAQVFRLTGQTHDYRASNRPLNLKSPLDRWEQHVKKEGALLPPVKDPAK